MDIRHVRSNRVRAVGAVVATAALVAAAGWGGSIARTQAASTQATAPVVTRQGSVSRDSYADIVNVVAPAVVTIRTEGKVRVSPTSAPDEELFRRFFGDRSANPGRARERTQRGLGSGVVVGRDGYILTNHHVVDSADTVRVDLIDGRSMTAKVIGTDPPSDLALLKVDATDLHAVALGDSDAVQVGDVVLAVGNPLGVGQTVTMGIV